MAKEISWAPQALDDYFKILDYLLHKFGNKTSDDFIEKTLYLISQLESEKLIFRESEHFKGVNEVLITKHNLLLYRIKKDKIEIVSIFDTRQHPNKKRI